jgi:filamentous hemagglutinin
VRVTVQPEALAEWSAGARRTATSLRTRIGALDDGLAPLVHTWHGPAADGFAARHRQWHAAADGLLDTLAALAELVDTAQANYSAAASANARIWQVRTTPPRVVVHAMAAGGWGRITADVEDIRAAVAGLAAAVDDLAATWMDLRVALVGTGAMAGGDEAGAPFATDYDAMAGAAWQGFRSSLLLLDGITRGLAATGNNLAAAERDSTPAGRPYPPITTGSAPTPAPAPPPTAAGEGTADQLSAYWPAAEPARLRAAGAAWRASAPGVRDAVRRAVGAVGELVSANPDPVLHEVHRFTAASLSDDPTTGLTGVLASTVGRIAAACDGLADLTERTRARLVDALAGAADGVQWYHPVADVLDRMLRLKLAHAIAAAGDAYLLELAVSAIRDDHVRAVGFLRGELHPAGADRLARLATATVPPMPVPADTCAVTQPSGRSSPPLPEPQRQALIADVVAAGHKITPSAVVHIARAPDGRVVWLERGDERSGLSHILRAERIADFLRRGVTPADVPGLAVRAVTAGTPVGRVGHDGTIYEVEISGGRREKVVVVIGSNGYIVSAYPLRPTTKIKPW